METRSRGRNIRFVLAALALAGSMLACSQGYVTPFELTMTANASTTIPTKTPTEMDTVTPTATELVETALPTFTNVPKETKTPVPTVTYDPLAPTKTNIIYYTQSGDTLPSITGRFGVSAQEIQASEEIPATGLINPGILLVIPDRLDNKTSNLQAMPDSEVVYSSAASDFDIEGYINQAGGYLSSYVEERGTGNRSGAEIVRLVALENSINPYLLLAILEYKSHWVLDSPTNLAEEDYPMGYIKVESRGLYHQLSWAVEQLSIGYYGWRAGNLTEVTFKDDTVMHLNPEINAGTAALQYLFAQWYDPIEWDDALYGSHSMPALMESMFGSFWARRIDPLYPTDLRQPMMVLPFYSGRTWSYTGGPHPAWGAGGSLAALDFAPPSTESGCVQSPEWVTAVAPGLVVRTATGVVIEDLDGDGDESTGWVIMYMHIATLDRVELGTYLDTNDKVGHPSCEGGIAGGTHLHIARKFNGEWMLAGGPVPFVLSGYTAVNGDIDYEGSLVNGEDTVIASPVSAPRSLITRP
jgi:murein DD-endopeptidase MepM/ murein hydrolase activator NlpD